MVVPVLVRAALYPVCSTLIFLFFLMMEAASFPEMLVIVTTMRTSSLTVVYIFIERSIWSVSAQEARGQWNNTVKLNSVESWISLQVFYAKSTDFAKSLWHLIFLFWMKLGVTIGWQDISKSTKYIVVLRIQICVIVFKSGHLWKE